MEKPVKLRADLLYLAKIGREPDEVLEGTGVAFEQIDALRPMAPARIAELYDVLAGRLPDDFAIRCGLATRYQYMGLLGYRLQNSGSIRELLETWNRYSIVIGYPLSSSLEVTGECWSLVFRPRLSLTPRALRFCMETSMAGSIRAIRAISGHAIAAVRYVFPFPAPDDLTRYAPLAPTPILFGGGAGCVVGRAEDLERRLAAHDEEAKAVCDEYCSQALARITQRETTGERLRTLFATSPGRLPSAAEAAVMLGLSLRTLQRQLLAEGQPYQRVVEAFRHEQACVLLAQGAETKTISYLLGFRDIGSFRRAFRSWTGQPPSHWRRKSRA